jgi:hypothetical protein
VSLSIRTGRAPREPFTSCPRYGYCSANDCPLDPAAALHGGPRHAEPGEEQQCRATRRVRERVAVAHGLPASFALHRREWLRDARGRSGSRCRPTSASAA